MATTDTHHPTLSPTNGGVHVTQAYTYANETARLAATGFTADDVGKDAEQQSDATWWKLTNHSPITWKNITEGAALTSTAPVNVTKTTAAAGSATEASRQDHKHDITTAAPGATGVATASGEGSATTLARSDHSHQSNTAPANTTKAAAVIGTSGQPARADHKHDVTTAAAGAATPGDAAQEGSASSLARSDHQHSLPAYGSSGGTFCQGNDSRLSDDRTASGIRTATTVVSVSGATAPTSGQVLKATSGTAATWQNESGGVFGTEHDYEEKTTEASTTSTSFQEYMSLTTASLPAGTYRIGWMFVCRGSSIALDFKVRLQVDNTTELINPGDSGNEQTVEEFTDSGSSQRLVRSGFRHVTLTAATHDIDMDFCCRASDGTLYMYHGQIEIWRVS